jgi:hypothetical protein
MPLLNNGDPKFHTQSVTIAATATGDDATVVYTVPANFTAVVRYLHFSNSDSSSRNLTVEFYHAKDAEYKSIAKTLAVAANTNGHLVNGGYFFLQPGDKIVAFGSSANKFDITISCEEYFTSSNLI